MFSDSDSVLVWEQGYVSTDVAEDNDDSSDSSLSSDHQGEEGSDEEEYYDEEDDEPDIDELIEKEKQSKGLTDVEREFIKT